MKQKKRCRCDCGYRCGGPGVCKLNIEACLTRVDGKHFVRDCEHDFSGPLERIGALEHSVRCKNCGMSALAHDMAVGP